MKERRASVVGKREEVHYHSHTDANGAMHMSTSTTNYATFEMDDGMRMELRIKGREYGDVSGDAVPWFPTKIGTSFLKKEVDNTGRFVYTK